MSLPGFTAETSLYKTEQHYQGAGSFAQGDGAIFPAQWPPGCRPIIGFRREERFIACLDRCRAEGGTPGGCWRGCCRLVTGSSCCYFV